MMDLAQMFANVATGISAAFGGPYFPAQVVSRNTIQYDTGGSVVPGSGGPTIRTCMAQVDSATESMRQAEGYTEKDQRILVLAATLEGSISTDNEIEILEGPNAGLWMIASVSNDPITAYHELRGRRA